MPKCHTLYKLVLLYLYLVVLLACRPSAPQPMVEVAQAPQSVPVMTKQYHPDYTVDYLTGKFDPALQDSFVLIDARLADRVGLRMRSEAYRQYVQMHDAAARDGVKLVIRSATRNHDYQRAIWEKKWSGQTTLSDGTNAAKDIKGDVDRAIKILEYSSMPGTSRHHWGTDIDLNAFTNSYFEQGEGAVVYQWLLDHASDYGYERPYTARDIDRPAGYQEEKWHWSYLPLSLRMTQDAARQLHDTLITGFEGDHTAPLIGVVDNYVLGINSKCKAWH